MNVKTITTFGKYMICPESLYDKKKDIAKVGLDDFNTYRFRHNSEYYKAKTELKDSQLLSYLSKGISKDFEHDKKPLLLLSDGKDSLLLAIAFNELGISCNTLTFLRNDDTNMKNYIIEVCKKLNHSPKFFTVDEIVKSIDTDIFKESFSEMTHPIMDQGYIFFLFGLKLYFDKTNQIPKEYVVYDGTGNDEYMGHMPTLSQLRSFNFSRYRLYKVLPTLFKSFKWYVRSESESHGLLSTLSCFFPLSDAYNLDSYFSSISKSINTKEFLDFRAFSRGNFLDKMCMMGKTVVATKYLSTKVKFPWTDCELSEYCFNIPLDQKVDFKNLKNKLPLRDLLMEKLDWQQDKRGVDLFLDLNNDFLFELLSTMNVPRDLINKVSNNNILNENIKKRAYLELLNFYSFCKYNQSLTDNEIRDTLSA